MKCDVAECRAEATRIASLEGSLQIRYLCKRDAKALPASDTTLKKQKPLWRVTRLPFERAIPTKKR